jgi:hypothetical protein
MREINTFLQKVTSFKTFLNYYVLYNYLILKLKTNFYEKDFMYNERDYIVVIFNQC